MTRKTSEAGKLISVNVGLPRVVEWKGRTITTGIFKEPVEGRTTLHRLNLDGDRQVDLTVHGGPDKAVYAYPAEHYVHWRQELPGMELPWGMFGENFSTEGLLEDSVNIGDRFRIGTAEVQVTQPRVPCYKLSSKFRRDDMIKRFTASQRSGFYLRVLQEGEVAPGDPFELTSRDANNVTVAYINRLRMQEDASPDVLQRIIELEALSGSWRKYFQKRQAKLVDPA